MADRYWVGGTGTWDGTNTTNWSATSGGSGGASVPTDVDDVYFNANSGGGTVSISSSGSPTCRSLSFFGYTGTYNASAYRMTVQGNLNTGTTATFSPGVRFSLNAQQISPASVIIGSSYIIDQLNLIPVSGATVDLASNINSTNTGNVFTNSNTYGTVNTNNYSISCNIFTISGIQTSAIVNLGSSNITAGTLNLGSTSGGTINFNSSTLNIRTLDILSGNTTTFNAGTAVIKDRPGNALSLYLNNNTLSIPVESTQGTFVFTSGTLASYKLTKSSGLGLQLYDANLTVSGLLQITGTSGQLDVYTNGAVQTLSAGSTNLSNITWQNITAAGAGSPFTGTGFVDGGGNTNIVFPPYYRGLFFGSNF